MIMAYYLDKLTPLVDSKGPDNGTGNNEIKEALFY